MSAQSTPGPWRFNRARHDPAHRVDRLPVFAGTEHPATVAYIIARDGMDLDELNANAALIARAPYLAAENERLRRERQAMLVALDAIASMEVNETTDHRQLSALVIAIAKQSRAGAI